MDTLTKNQNKMTSLKMDTLSIEEKAKAYYNALFSGDIETVKQIASPNLSFEDPTAPSEYPNKIDGLNAILEFFQSFTSVMDGKLKIIRSFSSNGPTVIYHEQKGTTAASTFEQEGDRIAYKIQGITVVYIVDEMVTRHIDYLDYKSLFASLKEAK